MRDLPEAWRARFQEDFGIVPPDDRDGAMQDVHWYAGPIGGEFQGYTLGNILSGQFFEAATKAHPEIAGEIGQGQFGTLHGWLKDNIYQHGSKYTASELIQRVTGQPLSIEPYIHYLRTKYGELYGPMSTPFTSFDEEFDAIPSARQEFAERRAVLEHSDRLGVVIGGSLSEGLDVKLDRDVQIEQLAVGRYVVARGRSVRFFCMVTDVALDSTNPLVAKMPPDVSDPFLAQVYQGTATFGTVHLSPLLILEEGSDQVKPVKTVPEHFTPVATASQTEVDQVFGEEGVRKVGGREAHFFHVGQPLDMDNVKITLNLERLVERSSGVFGKSGTGKTFLSRLLLAGVIQQKVAVNLIFDMHNEYGWEGSAEGDVRRVKGLKQIFPGQVSIFTLDDESSRRRGSNPDYTVTIGYDQIEPEDLEMLSGILGLSEVQVGAVYALSRRFRRAMADLLPGRRLG